MNRTTTRMMIAAAVMTVVTGIASAETMEAKIPFAFHFGNKMYSAGTYRVSVQGPQNIISLADANTGHATMALAVAISWPSSDLRAVGDASLTFECGLGRCQMTQIWTGYGQPTVKLPRPRLGRDEVATLRVIQMSRVNGD
jgi:hypothetical protein